MEKVSIPKKKDRVVQSKSKTWNNKESNRMLFPCPITPWVVTADEAARMSGASIYSPEQCGMCGHENMPDTPLDSMKGCFGGNGTCLFDTDNNCAHSSIIRAADSRSCFASGGDKPNCLGVCFSLCRVAKYIHHRRPQVSAAIILQRWQNVRALSREA